MNWHLVFLELIVTVFNLPSVALISELVLGKAQRFVVNKLSRQILGFSAPFCQPADINTQGVVGCTDQC